MEIRNVSGVRKIVRSFWRDNEIYVSEKFFMEMNSDGQLCFKGIKDVKDYSNSYVYLESDEYIVEISGCEMILKTFSSDSTCISGSVENIRFLCKKRGKI